MELGVYSFGDTHKDPRTGRMVGAHQRIRELIDEIALADQVGLDVFGVGEHHRADFSVAAPAMVLAAAAERTERIRLTSAVTVLGSEDPVRVFQQYATLDLLSDGRAEIMAGRGSFIESFPLFGYDLQDYEPLFAEKLELLLALREQETITWSGRYRAPLDAQTVYPRPIQTPLPVWIAVGGTPASVARAGLLGIPLAIAIIGGMPARFAPMTDLYRRAAAEGGHDVASLELGINSFCYIADTAEQAVAEFYPGYADVMDQLGRERGWAPTSRGQFDQLRSPQGSLLVGSPEEIVDKILYEHGLFGHTRFLAQMDVGRQSHERVMRSIELFGTRVAPEVRRALGSGPVVAAAPAAGTGISPAD
jgi:probable LLM family oxidoreductase